eukprot:scaffold11978_cov153-Amphora_coffeaeformis.AAC.1
MSSEDYRWMLVDDFVSFINVEREKFFNPSSELCVDESMVRWYGIGGDWINEGLPMYVDIDRKPEAGCEIQNVCDGKSGIMLRMMLVKSSKSQNKTVGDDGNESLNHGTKIIKYLVAPWARTHRVVVADSYFASVQTAQELFKLGLRFIGVVKTATRGFPMKQLTSSQFGGRGQWKSFFHSGNGTLSDPDLISFAWVDRNRRYFVSTVSNLREAAPISRTRLRQVDQEPNAAPEPVHLSIRQPQASKIYYDNCGRIDQHNRIRQADLKVERKYGTNDWSLRVNLSLFSICVVDSYLLWTGTTGVKESPHDFFSALAEELIDYGRVTRAQLKAIDDIATPALKRTHNSVAAGVGPHITPLKKKRSPGKDGNGKLYSEQKRCTQCGMKTTWACSECNEQGLIAAVCHTRVRCACWDEHVKTHHEEMGYGIKKMKTRL